jgi:UPF0755 protein
MRSLRLLLTLTFLVLLGGVGGLAWYAVTPMDTGAGYPQSFSITKGSSIRTAAADMARAGVLDHPALFVALARARGQAENIKAGSYGLMEAATPLELLRKITQGETLLGKVTFIEGWSFRELRQALDAREDLRHDSAGMTDAELLAAIGAQVNHPEGWFFPDTYFYDHGSSDLALYKRAHGAMRAALEENWAQRAPGLPYKTPEEVLTMASIIEKETGAPDERPMIAAVFLNRLRIGMRLQTDPTVIYGLGSRFDGNLRRVDLETDTPYNTYTRAGLPPTPIALPGRAAIEAALNPAPSRALYFVAMGNGRHVFSNNLDEHNRAVYRYQKSR